MFFERTSQTCGRPSCGNESESKVLVLASRLRGRASDCATSQPPAVAKKSYPADISKFLPIVVPTTAPVRIERRDCDGMDLLRCRSRYRDLSLSRTQFMLPVMGRLQTIPHIHSSFVNTIFRFVSHVLIV